MRRKIKVKYWNKNYRVWELTVWGYFLALSDIEQFIEEIFLEFNPTIPVLDEKQLKQLIQKLFEIESEDLDNLLNTKKKKEDPLEDFHIKIGFFMKFFSNSYEQTIATHLKVFNNIIEDVKIIAWEEKYDKELQQEILMNNVKDFVKTEI